jgi:hypothetical protein
MMSLLILDDQLGEPTVLFPLARRFSVRMLRSLRHAERILDDRVPVILLTLDRPTFVTLDHSFWDRHWCHPGYAILYFFIPEDEQEQIPGLLRALFRKPEFRTRAARMGKVARVQFDGIDFWQYRLPRRVHLAWD